MAAPKLCKELGCTFVKELPKHRCYWHNLLEMPIDEQIDLALKRRVIALKDGKAERARVPQSAWPAKRRWCSGCQWMVPMFYVQGTRCKACESHADYSRHLKVTYNITYDFYLAMYNFQGGRCYVCRRRPLKRRLAVDHDHKTDEVRGLLCSGERSCNHDILGNITSIDMARRIVTYLEDPPARAMKEGRDLPEAVASTTAAVMAGRSRHAAPTRAESVSPETARKIVQEQLEARARACWENHYSDRDFWRFPDDYDGPRDIFHAVPDRLDPEVWEIRLRLAREREVDLAARRARQRG